MTLTRAHGIDLSYWQTSLTQAANPPRPVDFVIQKLTEAVYKDAAYETLKQQIQWIPVRGGYHYLTGPARGSWKSQADIFLAYLTDDYHFWALDAEKMNNYALQLPQAVSPRRAPGPNGVPALSVLDKPAAGFVESVLLFMEYVSKNTSRPGLLYTNPDMWGTWLAPYQSDLARYDLWVSHYWYKPDPQAAPNYYQVRGAESMRRDWRFWQYDKNGQGGQGKEYGVQSKGLDLNVFNGTVEELQAWARVSTNGTTNGETNNPMEEPLTLESLERRVSKLESVISNQ